MAQKKFYETTEFKKLNAEWAKKLKKSGFNDIETNELDNVIRPQEFTTPTHLEDFVDYIEYVETQGLDYYHFCHQVLREFEFKKPLDKAVFELYTEGVTEREIERRLPSLGFKSISNVAIHKKIKSILDKSIPNPKRK